MTEAQPDHGPEGWDVAANRRARKYSRTALLGRGLWEVLRWPLFRLSPRPLWGWRRWLLSRFGARVGARVRIHATARIAIPWTLDLGEDATIGDGAILYGLGPLRIGRAATISQYAHLCAGTHDHTRPDFPLERAPVTVGDGVWVAADAFVGPGVTIGDYAIVAARAVVTRDVDPYTIVGGNPAKPIGDRPRFAGPPPHG